MHFIAALTLASALGFADPALEQARAAVRDANAAFHGERYADALAGYERAMALKPASSLHFNIAACHHALMDRSAPDSPEHQSHAAAARRAYRAYLDQNRDASDRAEVEAALAALPPEPTEPFAIERLESDAGSTKSADRPVSNANANANAFQRESPAAAPEASSPVPPTLPRLSLGVGLSLALPQPKTLAGHNDVAALPGLGGTFRLGVLLGRRRRSLLQAEVHVTGPVTTRQLGMRSGYFGAAYHHIIALPRHWQLEAGGVGGLAWQSLHRQRGSVELRCPLAKGPNVSTRGGLLAGARLGAGLDLGRRTPHVLGLLVTPAWIGMSSGTQDKACDGEPSAFAQFGIEQASGLLLLTELTYAARF